jgi:Zn-dependent peptidase ImmA (M78 family)
VRVDKPSRLLHLVITLILRDRGVWPEMTVREAEADARQLLDANWWPRDLPVDPFHLAGVLGIRVQTIKLPVDQSGKIDFIADGPIISLNSLDSQNRRRFTCAHEIGHYVKRGPSDGQEGITDYRDTLAGLGSDPREIYANQFAAALLMPAERVAEYSEKSLSVSEMASLFGTSTQAMELRLRNLRLDT